MTTRNKNFGIYELTVAKGVANNFVAAVALKVFKVSLFKISKINAQRLIIRSIVTVVAMYCGFYAFVHLPLSLYIILLNVGPLLALIFGYVLNSEYALKVEGASTHFSWIMLLVGVLNKKDLSPDESTPLRRAMALGISLIIISLDGYVNVIGSRIHGVHFLIGDTIRWNAVMVIGTFAWLY